MSTNQDQGLVVREEMALAPKPREVIANAKEQADALMEIVNDRELFAVIGGKPYLEAEAWEIILAFNKVAPDPVYVKPIYEAVMGEDDDLVAYEAKVNLVDQYGVLRGSGIAECSLESYPTQGREGRDKDKAAKSTAQTWAMSKAARMAYSWVAVLAGFEPTPASEMKGSATAADHGTCAEHGVRYFKSKNMRSPAHKTDDGGWCNKPEEARIEGPETAYGQDGQVDSRTPQEAAAGANDVGGIKNGGTFMEYVNARWPGHTSGEICGCLNVAKISDLDFKPKTAAAGFVLVLEKFWGTGTFDADGVITDPQAPSEEAEAAQEEGAAGGAPEDAEVEAAQTAP